MAQFRIPWLVKGLDCPLDSFRGLRAAAGCTQLCGPGPPHPRWFRSLEADLDKEERTGENQMGLIMLHSPQPGQGRAFQNKAERQMSVIISMPSELKFKTKPMERPKPVTENARGTLTRTALCAWTTLMVFKVLHNFPFDLHSNPVREACLTDTGTEVWRGPVTLWGHTAGILLSLLLSSGPQTQFFPTKEHKTHNRLATLGLCFT